MVKKQVKLSITVLLIWLFAFPILFQSAHIAWHRAGDCVHHCHIFPDNQSTNAVLYQSDEHCSICDFQFTVNDVPKQFVLESIAQHIVLLTIFQENPAYQTVSLQQSPRAPPVQLS